MNAARRIGALLCGVALSLALGSPGFSRPAEFATAWPIAQGQLTTGFGDKHQGIDIAAGAGTEVRAFASGIVVAQGARKGCGEFVEIRHSDDVSSRYCNLAQVRVRVEDTVKAGAPVGVIAAPTHGARAHLHFELKRGDKRVDPMDHLPRKPA